MNETHQPSHVSLPLPLKRRVDQVCDQFEAAWNAGKRPQIEEFLADTPEPERSTLLRELMALDLEFRSKSGEQPTLEEYCLRFPDHVELISEAFDRAVRRRLPESPSGSRSTDTATASTRTWHPSFAPKAPSDSLRAPGEFRRTEISPDRRDVRFGDYELLEEIAHGGMGVVYKARQVSLNRIVAVKMILAGQLASDEDIRRFRTEAEAAAQLQHPNIVAIHEVGAHDGQHFFSMDLVEGKSLATVVRDHPLPPRQAAEYVQTIAEAIHYAHGKGILHRDLKPSNVLIDISARPHVTDFGLAKRIEGGSDLTRSGAILGTPSYMPPEQASGERGEVGPASDVYSLGAVLYELLTGRPPFRAETPIDTVLQVLESEPVAPRLLNPKIDRDLETITLKCLQKEPARRYVSAHALADELRRYLAGEPIRARPVTAWERTVKWGRRRPAITGLLAGLVAVTLLGLGLVLWQWRAAVSARRDAETRAVAEAAARRQAELGFQQARRAIDDLSNLVEDPRLKELSGLRRELFARADQYYREFAQFLRQRGNDPAVAQDLGASYHKLAGLLFASGEISQAQESYRNALEIREKLAQQQPDRVDLQKNLALTYHGLAVMQSELSQAEDAFGNYDKASEIGEKLARDDPDNADIQRLLALDYNGRANLHLAARRLPEAVRLLEQAEGLLDRLVREQRGDAKVRWTLAGICFNLGRLKRDNPEESLRWHERSHELREELVHGDPGSSLYQRDLASSLSSIGILFSKSGRTEEAIQLHHRACELREALVRRDPENPTFENDLGAAFTNLADTLTRAGRLDEALQACTQSIEHARTAYDKAPQVAIHREFLINAYYNLADVYLKLGHASEAAEPIAMRKKLVTGDATELYDVACQWATCADLVAKGKQRLTAEEETARTGYADQAVEALREAIAAGFKDFDHMQNDSDLNPIRDHPGYKELIEKRQ